MNAILHPPKATERKPPSEKVKLYTDEVVYIYAFDVAYDVTRQPIRSLLGQPVAPFAVDASKRSPRQLHFYKPQMVRLPTAEHIGPRGPVRVERVIKLLPVGAISITVRVPFAVEHIEDLVEFHDLQFSHGSLHDEVRRLAEHAVTELEPHLIRPHSQLVEEEAYTVFCVASPLVSLTGTRVNAERWFQAHRRQVAALLTQEEDMARLSKQESDESTARFLSYYEDDIVVVDWDAALLIDEPRDFDETLYIMELANLQLAELEAYDRILDAALDRAYRDLGVAAPPRRRVGGLAALGALFKPGSAVSDGDEGVAATSERPLRSRGDILREIRELRIDLARMNDELSNITKFFGDWHLARIYEKLASRFHLAEWHRTIDGKLKTLNDLYQLLRSDQNNRLMVWLEATIVLLFIVDLIVLAMGL
jgi:hypothetical protein